MDSDWMRAEMVERQLRERGIKNQAVLGAMATLQRHRFIPQDNRDLAYQDGPVSIGEGQTISQPYLVALMSQELQLRSGMSVLEVGTGSGYQTAVLGLLGAKVRSMEIRPKLLSMARETLGNGDYGDIQTHLGCGFDGLSDAAPYDRILVTAAPEFIPDALVDQLKLGGMMLIPVGERKRQTLLKVERTVAGIQRTPLIPVLFVPMTPGLRGSRTTG
jgi:protein-L-isoaspartate(D-aspartate) O-methyltransferase